MSKADLLTYHFSIFGPTVQDMKREQNQHLKLFIKQRKQQQWTIHNN